MYATIDVNQRLSEIVASAANAEDLLEEAGIDYWFGWDRPLKAACESAHVDPGTIAFRLIARDQDRRDDSDTSLVALFSRLDQHFEVRLEPALIRASREAEALEDAPRNAAIAILDVITRVLRAHVETMRRSLSPVAAAVDIGVSARVDGQMLRHLALEHATLAARSDDLRALADRLDDSAFATAARALIREIHQHNKISYNFVLPRLAST